MPVTPSRAAAFDVLLRVEEQSSYAVDLLHSDRLSGLSPADHRLCTELVMGVMRWRSWLDAVISAAAGRAVSRMDVEVLVALRLAAYQLRFLARVPRSAAVNESVEMVKRARKRSAVPFANAVLRKLSAAPPAPGGMVSAGDSGAADFRASEVAADVAAQPETAAALAERLAHPLWLVERWIASYGLAATARICASNQVIPTTAVRLSGEAVEAELVAEGIRLAPGLLLRGARRVISGDLGETKAFTEGRVAIQDEASQLVALLLGTGNRILDCCAAPGNKSAALAARMPQAKIIATELHHHRARAMRERQTPAAIQIITADARSLPLTAGFDRVLADVPCSGTGTLARNPEIKWRLAPADLNDLQGRQVAILRSALEQVVPGGRVLYSTCSLEPEENQQVIDLALAPHANNQYLILDCGGELQNLQDSGELTWPEPASLAREKFLTTLPGTHPCDGFFAALIERQA